MEKFSWASPTKIMFGLNQIENLGNEIKSRGFKKILITYGHSSIKKNGIYDAVVKQLNDNSIAFVEYGGIDPNPRIQSVIEAGNLCKKENVDLILAVGGGSVADCSKGIALFRYYEGNDFWQEIKNGTCYLIKQALPIGVVLTLSATGSEMNNGGVISNLKTNEKIALFSSFTHPIFSILDPSYTYSVPKHQISAGMVDAFSHCLEQFFSVEDNSHVSDNILIGIMKSIKDIGTKAIDNPTDYTSHATLMWSATMALNYLSGVGKTGDWATHAMEHSVSAFYDITHAVGLAIITPHWMEYVLDEKNAYRFKPLTYIFNINVENKSDMVIAKEVIANVRNFFTSINMPQKLSAININDERLDAMTDGTFAPAFYYQKGYVGNFKPLKNPDVKAILKSCI
jgi:alcohol dehydrogenase YqhD (iron-dependent ADH family)